MYIYILDDAAAQADFTLSEDNIFLRGLHRFYFLTFYFMKGPFSL